MKTLLTIAFLFFASAAFGQINFNQPQTIFGNRAEHMQHATRSDMRPEHNLQGSWLASTATGERPLWEFKPEPETPLGDIARAYREEHAKEPKATIVVEDIQFSY